MTISYHSGERIQATSTDFGTDGAGIPAISGGWKEVGRTTLGSAGDTINVTGLADKRYLMILKSFGGSTGGNDRLNGDSGSNYAGRYGVSGGSDYTTVNKTAYPWSNAGYSSTPNFIVEYISNLAGKEKLIIRHWVYQYLAGATDAPRNAIGTFSKWANTTDAINAVSMYSQTTDWDSGSEIVVLGWDENDTHTDNFWEELANVNATGSSNTLSTGTFTAKKYLWVQIYADPDGSSAVNPEIRLNSDSGSNYARRAASNGGSYSASVSQTQMAYANTGTAVPVICNMFMVNKSANEKLCFLQSGEPNTAGAGNAPKRMEGVYKWANTSDQCTEIEINQHSSISSNNFGSNSFIKVWGSD